MAEDPGLFLLPLEEADGEGGEEEEEEEELDCKETPDPVPYWSSTSDHSNPSCDNDLFIPVFSSNFPFPGRRISSVSYDSDPEYDHGSDYLEDQLTLSIDLFDRSPPQLQGGGTMDPFPEILDSCDFRVLDGVEDMGSDYLGLGLVLGLGSRFERQEEEEEEEEEGEEEDGMGGNQEMGSDWGGDELFVGRGSSVSQSGDRPIDGHMDRQGLRIVGFGSDSDSEDDQITAIGSNPNGGNAEDRISDDVDVGLPLCWDCLRIDDRGDQDEDFEWEEVDGRLDEREVLSMMFAADDDRSSRELDADLEEEVSRNV